MSDLIERLRELPTSNNKLRDEAVDEIERLTSDLMNKNRMMDVANEHTVKLQERIAELEADNERLRTPLGRDMELLAEDARMTRRIAKLEAALQYVKGRMVHSRCPRCADNHEVAIAALQEDKP